MNLWIEIMNFKKTVLKAITVSSHCMITWHLLVVWLFVSHIYPPVTGGSSRGAYVLDCESSPSLEVSSSNVPVVA